MESPEEVIASIEGILEDYHLQSSSSSSDDCVAAILTEKKIQSRVNNFVDEVISKYSDTQFKENFRITLDSAYYLIERYSKSERYKMRSYRGGRSQSTAESEMLSFLWFCANKTTIREVSNLYNRSLSKTHSCFHKVLKFLVNDLAPETIRFPKEDFEKEAIADDFKKIAGFPNVLGCIDDTYISARKPKNKIRSTYINRHDGVSITMQAICDAKLRFLDVFTGVPSNIHDARVLKLSFIGKQLPRICAPKYYLLGDSSYPLREYLLTPFRGYKNLGHDELTYNLKFFWTRVKIENAFGLLKSRFRQLMRLDFHNVETMGKFVIACCSLHNICIDRNDFYQDEPIPQSEMNNSDDSAEHFIENRRQLLLSQLGRLKREEVKNYFTSM